MQFVKFEAPKAFRRIRRANMIIPIRCMNCGNILADKWLFYQEEVKKEKERRGNSSKTSIYMDGKSVPDTAELKVLEYLKLKRYCCRKHMLTHVDLIDKI
jgi:DNA-directed RNA polymerase I, II, and III subunit RPABC5